MKRQLKAAAAAVEQPAGDRHVSHELPQVVSPWMTTAQCAAYLQFPTVRAFQVWLYTDEGQRLPRNRRGSRTLLFHRDLVDAYLNGQRRPVKRGPRKLSLIHGSDSDGGQR